MDGFEWIDLNHRNESVIVFKRKGKKIKDNLLIILNMTPVVHMDWKVYTSDKDEWQEVFNSDRKIYQGSGDVLNPSPTVTLVDKKNKVFEINVHLPALGAVILK